MSLTREWWASFNHALRDEIQKKSLPSSFSLPTAATCVVAALETHPLSGMLGQAALSLCSTCFTEGFVRVLQANDPTGNSVTGLQLLAILQSPAGVALLIDAPTSGTRVLSHLAFCLHSECQPRTSERTERQQEEHQ
jgi:hypothetical protein